MPTVILRVKRDCIDPSIDTKIDHIIHSVPLDVYHQYVKEIQCYQFALIHLRELPYNLALTNIKEVEAEFNNFLRNPSQKIKGCYEVLHTDYKQLDFTTTINP